MVTPTFAYSSGNPAQEFGPPPRPMSSCWEQSPHASSPAVECVAPAGLAQSHESLAVSTPRSLPLALIYHTRQSLIISCPYGCASTGHQFISWNHTINGLLSVAYFT